MIPNDLSDMREGASSYLGKKYSYRGKNILYLRNSQETIVIRMNDVKWCQGCNRETLIKILLPGQKKIENNYDNLYNC